VDHRRYRLSEEGRAFGRCDAAILRPARQARELSGGVSLSVANHGASLPVAYRLYLPEEWAADAERAKRHTCRIDYFPDQAEIALQQIKDALTAGIPRGVVLMDAAYGGDTDLRTSIAALGLSYAGGIPPNATVWQQGTAPLPPKPWSGRGRRPTRLRRDAEHQPVEVKALAISLAEDAWHTITWRDGTAVPSPRDSLACESAPPTEIINCRNAGRKNGCWPNGPKAKPNRPNTGLKFPRISHSNAWSTLTKLPLADRA